MPFTPFICKMLLNVLVDLDSRERGSLGVAYCSCPKPFIISGCHVELLAFP